MVQGKGGSILYQMGAGAGLRVCLSRERAAEEGGEKEEEGWICHLRRLGTRAASG